MTHEIRDAAEEQSDRRAHRDVVDDRRALKRVTWIALTAINLRRIMFL
jgi:hypothetical protein